LEFVRQGAALMGVDTTKLREEQAQVARPYRVLGSERGTLLPPLGDALARYIAEADAQLAQTQPADSGTPGIAAGA
jgi:hypothetical protein